MRKILFTTFFIVLMLLVILLGMDTYSALSEDNSINIYSDVSEESFNGISTQMVKPTLISIPYDPAQSVELSVVDGFEKHYLEDYETGGICYEIEVDISELSHIEIPPEDITENGTVILTVCEE